MNFFLYIITLILLAGCVIQNKTNNVNFDSDGIIYLFPKSVQQLLNDKIEKEEEQLYFIIDKISKTEYRLYVNVLRDSLSQKVWIDNTNRFLYLRRELYPLIFASDEDFSTTKSAKSFLESISPNGSYESIKISVMRHNVYHIDFTVRGEILYEGY